MLETLLITALLGAHPMPFAAQTIDATSSTSASSSTSADAQDYAAGGITLADIIRAQAAPESLQGFETVVLAQLNAAFGSENLPQVNGAPVEPGIYLTVSPTALYMFDAEVTPLSGGLTPPGPASRECKSGCKQLLWAGFRRLWLQTLEEAQRLTLEVPTRVMFGAEASVPAKTIVELAYAAGETRPGVPPNFSLLVNGGNAGLRARPFYVLPPGGMRVAPGDNALGLRISLSAGESFEISAAHPRFAPRISGTGWKELAKQLVAIKKKYPNKTTLVIDVGDASVGDVAMVMLAANKKFANFVLTDGLPIKWG